MADGMISNRARLAVDVNTALHTVPANTAATVNINIVNHGPDPAVVKVAITDGGAPADGDWIETAVTLAAGQTLLRTNEPTVAGEVIYAVSDKATVDARVSGYQEDM
jgi:hypothetical protein